MMFPISWSIVDYSCDYIVTVGGPPYTYVAAEEVTKVCLLSFTIRQSVILTPNYINEVVEICSSVNKPPKNSSNEKDYIKYLLGSSSLKYPIYISFIKYGNV
jgi:hypothetical protein